MIYLTELAMQSWPNVERFRSRYSASPAEPDRKGLPWAAQNWPQAIIKLAQERISRLQRLIGSLRRHQSRQREIGGADGR